MKKEEILRKLTSRKLWVAVVGIVVGMAGAFGITENEYAQIVGLITASASAISYIIGEAKIDVVASEKTEKTRVNNDTRGL